MPTPDTPAQALPAVVRQPLLSGHRPVAGLWLPAAWLDEGTRNRRILAAWQPGAHAFRFADGDLLRYAAPQAMDCAAAGGWPLHWQQRTLCSAPLSAEEAAALPAADLWLVRGAQVETRQLQAARPLEPADWLELDGCTFYDTADCSAALPEPQLLVPEARELREVLGNAVGAASGERQGFLAQLAKLQPPPKPAAPAAPPPSTPTAGSSDGSWLRYIFWPTLVVLGLRAIVESTKRNDRLVTIAIIASIGALALLILLIKQISRTVRTERQAAATPPSRPAVPGNGPASGLPPAAPAMRLPARMLARVAPQRWRDWLTRLALTTGVARLLGRQQAAYLRRTMEMFDRGDLREALRHAIPLGGDGQSLGQAFGTPAPRSDLSLSRTLGPATSIHLGDALNAHLQQLYRKAFERLDREQRIDEAVFVLAELLSNRREALDYLERKQRYTQAAELALAWDQPPAVIVRLYCLAGDWRRAVAVARRDGAFADAVLQLQAKWPDAARRLRVYWGEAEAERGNWLAAVDAVWPVEEARRLAVAWLESAEAADGPLAARALVQRATLLPDTLQAYADRIRLLRDQPAQVRERAALALALLAVKPLSPTARRLGRTIAPALLDDQCRDAGGLDRNQLRTFLNLIDDPLLNADLPRGNGLPVPRPTPLQQRPPVEWTAPEAGLHPIYDAVPLADGRFLLALGEAGVAVADGSGCLVTRFAVPAESLVISHNRQIALALIRREQSWRVSRIDLANRKAGDLGMIRASCFAPAFDGLAWTVALDNRLLVLDTSRSLQQVMWQVGDLPGSVEKITSTCSLEQVLVCLPRGQVPLDRHAGHEVWHYALPQRRLTARERAPEPLDGFSLRLLASSGGTTDLLFGNSDVFEIGIGQRSIAVTLDMQIGLEEYAYAADGKWLVVPAGSPFCGFRMVALDSGKVHARIGWPRPTANPEARPHRWSPPVQVRMQADEWLFFDLRGRLMHVDPATSQCRAISLR